MSRFHSPYSKALQLVHALDLHKNRAPEIRHAAKIASELTAELHTLWEADEPNDA